jgi:hypothetical protein
MTKASELFITPPQPQQLSDYQPTSIGKTSRNMFSPSSSLFPDNNNNNTAESNLVIPPFDQIDPFVVESALYPGGGALFGPLGPVGITATTSNSEERSDTPNSSYAPRQQQQQQQRQRPYSSILTTADAVDHAAAQSGSSSSDASTSTAVQSSPGSFSKSPQIGDEIAKHKSKGNVF